LTTAYYEQTKGNHFINNLINATMEKNIWKLAVLFMTVMCMTFTFTACEDLFGDDGEESKFSDYFTMSITRCERVGNVLVFDWTIKNKSKVDAQNLLLNMQSVYVHGTDNTGGTYYYGDVSVGGNGSSFSGSKTVAVLAGETIEGKIRFDVSDMSDNATKFTLKVSVRCEEMDVDEKLDFKNISITDNRVLSEGIQTNDTNLSYTVNSCKRDNDGNVILAFTVKNNTGILLQKYQVNISGFTDNVSSSSRASISLTGDNWVDPSIRTDIAAGDTQIFYIKISGLYANATWISGSALITSDSYNFEYGTLSFLNIPIQ